MQGNSKSEKQTLVEEGTEFKGTLNSSCPVVVRGALNGELIAPAVTVTQTGTMTGKVQAKSVRSEGVLAGTVEADEVYLSGTVRSDTVIRARSLEVKLTPDRGRLEVTFGESTLDIGDDPTEEAHRSEDTAAGTGNGRAAVDLGGPERDTDEPSAEIH